MRIGANLFRALGWPGAAFSIWLASGCSSDPCEGISQACLAVRLEASGDQGGGQSGPPQSDQLRVFITKSGGPSTERTSLPASGQPAPFPIAFNVLVGDPGGTVGLDVIAELSGTPLLRGQGSETVAIGEHKSITIPMTSSIGALPTQTPPPRSEAGFAYFPDRGVVVMFGGKAAGTQGQLLNDTWEYTPKIATWTQISSSSAPEPRTANLTYHPRRKAMVLFGGLGANGQALADMWIYDASAGWSPVPLTSAPTPRHRAAIVYDYARGVLELYGGQNPGLTQPLSDFWELPADSSAWSVRAFNPPVPVVSPPRLIYDGANTLLIGSDESNQSTAKVWRADIPMWTELMGTAPQPSQRNSFAAALDRQGGMLVMFGGIAAGSPVGDTYFFAPTNFRWSLNTTQGPSPRSGAYMDYVPELKGLLLFSGQGADGVPLSDRWLLVDTTWQQLP